MSADKSNIPACYYHNWFLLMAEGPPWQHRATWECLKCGGAAVTQGCTPANYPQLVACERLCSDIDSLQSAQRSYHATLRCIVNADIIAYSIWNKLKEDPMVIQNLADMPEPQILAIIDKLVTGRCDVTRFVSKSLGTDSLRIKRPVAYTEVPPWISAK